MSDLPERIWACMGGPMVGLFVSGGNNGGWPEYVSADIVQSLTAERDRLRAALEEIADHDTGATAGLAYTAKIALKGETP